MTFLRQSASEHETVQIGADIAQALKARQAPACLALHGDLGAGKSVLARSIIRALTGNPALDVPSPTFTLMQSYETAENQGVQWPVHHFDLYRLEDPEEVLELGWEELISEGICLIEWPEKAGGYLPQRALHLYIEIDANRATERLIKSDDIS